jgi:predicted phosphohydrolase
MIIDFNNKKLFAFADTHGNHRKVSVPVGTDIVVFAGDACEAGDMVQLQDFFVWFSNLPVAHKLFVPGNHDLPFEFAPDLAKKMIPEDIIFVDEGKIVIDDICFYVLTVRPWMHFATYLPSYVDILVTHGTPLGILDQNFGCPILRKLVDSAQPKIHIFGHAHFSAGQSVEENGTKFYNVAVISEFSE